MLLVCVLYCLWGYFTFSICSSSSMGDLAVQDPQNSASSECCLCSKYINVRVELKLCYSSDACCSSYS